VHGAPRHHGSTVIVRGSARAPQYAAAKYGILGVTKSYAHAFAPTVRVNVFAPGFIQTESTPPPMHMTAPAELRAAPPAVVPGGARGDPGAPARPDNTEDPAYAEDPVPGRVPFFPLRPNVPR
jgi:NAD(P)-dependent dehydrogenase (short-subunit alcohol dehydrogenase family)